MFHEAPFAISPICHGFVLSFHVICGLFMLTDISTACHPRLLPGNIAHRGILSGNIRARSVEVVEQYYFFCYAFFSCVSCFPPNLGIANTLHPALQVQPLNSKCIPLTEAGLPLVTLTRCFTKRNFKRDGLFCWR